MRFIVCCLAFALVASARVDGNDFGNDELVYDQLDVKQAFVESSIGDVIPGLPSELLTIKFGSQEALLGNEICAFDTFILPFFSYNGSARSRYALICINSERGFYLNGTYDESFLIYLVINIPGERVNEGDLLSGYKAALPIPGTGQNRNICVVYRQPKRIKIDADLLIEVADTVKQFNISDFLKEYGLGTPIAGNFYLTSLSLPYEECDTNCECDCCSS